MKFFMVAQELIFDLNLEFYVVFPGLPHLDRVPGGSHSSLMDAILPSHAVALITVMYLPPLRNTTWTCFGEVDSLQ